MAKYRTYPAQRRAINIAAAKTTTVVCSAPTASTAARGDPSSSARRAASNAAATSMPHDPPVHHGAEPLRHRLRVRLQAMRHSRTTASAR